MNNIKCFWAGRQIVLPDLDNDLSVEEKIEDIQRRLSQKQIKLSACGTDFLITELCVDVIKGAKLVAMHNLKA